MGLQRSIYGRSFGTRPRGARTPSASFDWESKTGVEKLWHLLSQGAAASSELQSDGRGFFEIAPEVDEPACQKFTDEARV